ncbi:MAG: hypothetical protein ACQR33_03200 [Candidatus Saccharibacteria bacterium]
MSQPLDMLKHEDLQRHSDVLTGKVNLKTSWRVQSGNRLTQRFTAVDLDALGLIANAQLEWVSACHKKDIDPFGGAAHYGGDTKAHGGQAAFETVTVDIDALSKNPNAEYLVFGATCFNNSAGLGKLAEMSFSVEDLQGNFLAGPRMRGIVNSAATARFGVLLKFIPGGAVLVEIDDMYNVPGSLLDWRPLATAATQVIERNR